MIFEIVGVFKMLLKKFMDFCIKDNILIWIKLGLFFDCNGGFD